MSNIKEQHIDNMQKQGYKGIHHYMNAMFDLLIEKNKRYGNAALEPLNVFSKETMQHNIEARLDDKLARIKNSDTLRANDVYDLIGYCILLCVREQWELPICD